MLSSLSSLHGISSGPEALLGLRPATHPEHNIDTNGF